MQSIEQNPKNEPLLELLTSLNQLGVSLSVTQDTENNTAQLKVSGDKSKLTPQLIGTIKSHKDAIVDMLGQQHQRAEVAPLERLNAQQAPLSTYQRGIWFLMQVQPDSSAYNSHFEFCITGLVDVQRLQNAWQAVLERHDILRTAYGMEQDQPFQKVNDAPWDSFHYRDFRLATDKDIQAYTQQFVKQSFDLEKGELCQLALLDVPCHHTSFDNSESQEPVCDKSSQQHILLICMHHIVIDIWSVELLMKDIMQAYHSQSTLPELPLQYLDFASWQQKAFEAGKAAKQRLFWESYLLDAPKTSLALKETWYDENALGKGGTMQLALTGADKVTALANRLGVTPFSFYLAVFQLTLSCFADEQDLTIGTPLVNRVDPRLEDTIGYFTNVLPVRCDIDVQATVADIIKTSHRSLLSVMENQDMTLDEIARHLNVDRNLSHSPFYSIDFSYHKNTSNRGLGGDSAGKGELVISSLKEASAEALFELSFSLLVTDDSAGLTVLYDKGLFSPDYVMQLLQGYQHVLTAVLSHSQLPWQQVQLPGAAPLEWINNHKLQLEENWTQRFKYVAEQYPDAIACIDDSEQLSYSAFWQQSGQLAAYLQEQGVNKGDVVALHLPPGIAFATSLQAVLRLGAIVMPVDVSLPKARKLTMLQHSPCKLMIAEVAEDKAMLDSTVLFMHYPQAPWRCKQNGCEVSPVKCSGSDGAFLFYTSGTTGQPKAIVLPHAALNSLASGMAERLQLSKESRVLQFASVGFSVLLEECFPGWSCGSAVVFSQKLKQAHPASLCELMAQKAISVVELSAGMWKQLILFLEENPNALPDSLDTVLLGCETISRDWLVRWQKFGVNALTVFGLSETSVTNATALLPAEDTNFSGGSKSTVLPIGEVFAGSRLYVLDSAKRLVLPGASGELYVGGPALQGRYLSQELNAERYLPDPFAGKEGAVMFKTGDQVRRIGNHDIQHLGRRDRQLKIQGHRVELSEIEGHINALDYVSNAVVRYYQQDEKASLCCFVKLKKTVAESTLLTSLRSRMPYYMVPSRVCFVAELPLNSNSKIDENALKDLLQKQQQLGEAPARDLSENEHIVADAFTELLKVSKVRPDDNFFKLGGHSLMAMGLLTRIQAATGVSLTIRDVFENPSVEDLAKALEQEQGPVLPALIPQPKSRELPLSFSQRRIWFIDRLMENSTQYNMPYAFKLNGELDLRALQQALNHIVQRHETLRTTYTEVAGEPVGHVNTISDIAINHIDLSHLDAEAQEAEAASIAASDAAFQFDLARDLMLRVTMLRLSAHSYAVLLNVHHIAADGLSVNILIDELSVLYRDFVQNKSASLAKLPVSYSDYSVWQKQWMEGQEDNNGLKKGMEYWVSRLSDLPEVHALPLDRPRPKIQSFKGAHLFSRFDASTSRKVKDFCQQHEVTEFMFWQTAFALLIARFSHHSDVVMGTPVAGRITQNVEPLVGCFINTLVLRSQFEKGDAVKSHNFIDCLKKSKQDLLAAYAWQHVPFEHLVDEINPSRSTSHSPLFQILFRLDNFADAQIELGDGITLEGLDQENSTTQYELTLAASNNNTGSGGDTELCWSYATAIFDESTIRSMADCFQLLVPALLAHPEKSVWQHGLINESFASKNINAASNSSVGLLAAEQNLLQQIQSQFSQTPHKPALHFASHQSGKSEQCYQPIGYQQLKHEVDVLSTRLMKAGIVKGARVGVLQPRGPESIISMLAIMQVGGVFVPLDLSYPANRLKYMIEDSKLEMLLTHSSVAKLFSDESSALLPEVSLPRLYVDELVDEEPTLAVNLPLPSASDVAYVIYTSGTTGQPKGIEIQHGALANFVAAMSDILPSKATKKPWLMMTSINFDISLFEWLGCLSSGNCCHVISDELSLDPKALSDYINDKDWGFIQTTPSRWSQLFDTGLKLAPDTVVASGGEALTLRLVELFRESKVHLLNCYGPTEATVWSMVQQVDLKDPTNSLLLGGTLAGYQHLVLDELGNECPVGAMGELHIGGASLAKGYLNREALTQERFINWSDASGNTHRLYKTGDKVRRKNLRRESEVQHNADSFVYCGRADHQVKLRGYRIELEEIEQQLMQLESIGDAVVLLKEQTLVAYLTAKGIQADVGEASLLPAQQAELIQNALSQSFPEYMVPKLYVAIPAMPLTPNGKIDRKQLPDFSDMGSQKAEQPPQGEYEEFVASCWSELLLIKSSGIDRHANFFSLGGHSLLTVRFLAMVKEAFEVELPVNTIFANPKLLDIAGHLENAVWLHKGVESDEDSDMELLEL